MRITHMVASIAELAAGPSHSVPALCDELAAAGHDVELHVIDYGGATHRAGMRYALHTYPLWKQTKRLGASPELARGLVEAARRSDVLHSHGLWMLPNLYAASSIRGTRCKLVTAPRGTLEPAALERSRLAKRAAWLLAQGPAVKRSALLHATSVGEARSCRDMGLRAPIAVVENGIYLPSAQLVAQARARASATHTLLYLGRVHPIKALDQLLEAWARVAHDFPHWQLRIVGPDADGYVQRLRAQAHSLGAPRVEFAPALFGDDRDRAYAEADLYVLPSHSENFAMSVAEALSAGVPVVCSRGAPWSSIEERGCGLWVDNRPPALADGLAALMRRSRAERRAMGDRARAWMEADYAWSGKARQLADAYEWVVRGAISEARPECVRLATS